MFDFFNCITRSRSRILKQFGGALPFCEALIAGDDVGLPEIATSVFFSAPHDLRDYLIATSYAILIGKERRKYLSAYFTPPTLCSAVLEAVSPFLKSLPYPRVLDPACGGGAFLVPVARHLVSQTIARGVSPFKAAQKVTAGLQGIELDPGLAILSRKLIAGMLKREFAQSCEREVRDVVREADTLAQTFDKKFDLVIGNPPYGRVGSRISNSIINAAGRANNGGHTNFYSLFLLKALDAVRPGGRLVFILPTSFVAGPYFAGLRQELLDRANVVRLDLHEDRENLFIGAIQDVCLLVLDRRRAHDPAVTRSYELGIIDGGGRRRALGSQKTPQHGEPWTLPVETTQGRQHKSLANGRSRHFTLNDYGYRLRVGKVVPTRERAALRTKPDKHTLPLVWASAVRPDGSFSASGNVRSKNPLWFRPPDKDVAYATKAPSVLVQRTSNRDQHRRLNAAAVCRKFLAVHRDHGFVAENHVIVLEAVTKSPPVSPEYLAKILNSAVLNERFSAVSGSFSVSARILNRVALPDPMTLPSETDRRFSKKLEDCFALIDGVLIPQPITDRAQNTIDQSGNLTGSFTVNYNTGLKARRLASPQKIRRSHVG